MHNIQLPLPWNHYVETMLLTAVLARRMGKIRIILTSKIIQNLAGKLIAPSGSYKAVSGPDFAHSFDRESCVISTFSTTMTPSSGSASICRSRDSLWTCVSGARKPKWPPYPLLCIVELEWSDSTDWPDVTASSTWSVPSTEPWQRNCFSNLKVELVLIIQHYRYCYFLLVRNNSFKLVKHTVTSIA